MHMNFRVFSKWIAAVATLFIACAASYHIGHQDGMRGEYACWITRYTRSGSAIAQRTPPYPPWMRFHHQIDHRTHGMLNIVDAPFPTP